MGGEMYTDSIGDVPISAIIWEAQRLGKPL
jgi:hypothetical protein